MAAYDFESAARRRRNRAFVIAALVHIAVIAAVLTNGFRGKPSGSDIRPEPAGLNAQQEAATPKQAMLLKP